MTTKVSINNEKRKKLLLLLAKKKKDLLEKKRQIEKQNKEKASFEKKIRAYEEENKLLYFNQEGKGYLGKNGKWESNPIQKQYFESLKNPRNKIFALTGANRIAKTFSTSGVTTLTCLLGHFPWEDKEVVGTWLWNQRNWDPPIKIRVVGQDWEKHVKAVLIPTFQELWPKSMGMESKKNNVGVEAYWTQPGSGSTVEVMSNKSDAEVFEGAKMHAVIYDEPPRRDVRVACARGLIDYNGIEIFAMTLLKEAWVDQEVINATLEDGCPDPTVWSIIGDIQDNVGFGITQEGVDQFAKTLTEDEKSARLRGVPSYKAGLCLNIDRNKHLIDRFEIPSHWIIDVGIDIGPSKGHDILYIATDTVGFKFVCFEEHVNTGGGKAIGESIIQKKNRYNLRINRVICDPLAKGDKTNENSVWEHIDMALNRHDMYLEAGAKDKTDGIIIINDLLMPITKMPALFVFRDLPITIRQLSGWMYDKEGKPQKKDDDMCENLYRLALLETVWEEPQEQEYHYSNIKKDSVTGY